MEYLSDQLNKCKSDKQIYKLLYKIRTQYANNEQDVVRWVFTKKNFYCSQLIINKSLKIRKSCLSIS